MKESQSTLEPLSGWQILSFDACATQTGIDRKASVPQSDYQQRGPFPVVDQGAGLNAGYTDREDLVHEGDLPLILFGHHTRVYKSWTFRLPQGLMGPSYFVLKSLQTAVEIQDRIVVTLKELKAATMARLFREGLRGETTELRQTPFGEVPAHWTTAPLAIHAEVQTGVAKGRELARG